MAVRICGPESVSISFSNAYLSLVTDAPIQFAASEELIAPELKFAAIKIPVEKPVVRTFAKNKTKNSPVIVKTDAVVEVAEMPTLAANELPFQETIKLEKVEMKEDLATNMVALYKDFAFEETIVAKTDVVVDEVSTTVAAAETPEPEFFDYPADDKKSEPAKKIESPVKKTDIEIAASTSSDEVEVQDVADLMEDKETAVAESTPVESEFFDYPEKTNTQAGKVTWTNPAVAKATEVKKSEEVVSSNLVAFDYSKANQDVTNQVIPAVVKVSSHKSSKITKTDKYASAFQQADKNIFAEEKAEEENAKASFVPTSYPVSISILALGTNLKKLENVQGFEVRFQDDLSEAMEDYGSGEVKFEAELSQPKMTRTVTILKRGYTPVTTEIILEEGAGSVTIPLVEEDTLNELMVPFERRGPVGALLVELDDETEVAKLDVPFGEVVKLNGDLKRTENEDFRYQLFVGVQAGNAMVSYHRNNGEVVSKIVHIHENEITHDANFYEDVVNEKIRLYEEDLLAKESSPLIISGDQVKIFATNSHAKKINNHTYKMAFGSSHLGGRRYLELNHQSEPVFVGIRDNNNVTVPSENFMRFILSKVEGAKLGNRCLVQVNLTKKAQAIEVASESIAQSLMTSTQMLDSDGKFYDSLSDKTRKIIVIGEGQGAQDISPDAKVNIKIQYQDGSVQFLNSYCSPNTYLVEQL